MLSRGFKIPDTGVADVSVQGFSWDTVSLPVAEVAPGFASDTLASILSEVTGVECGLLSTRNVVASKELAAPAVRPPSSLYSVSIFHSCSANVASSSRRLSFILCLCSYVIRAASAFSFALAIARSSFIFETSALFSDFLRDDPDPLEDLE